MVKNTKQSESYPTFYTDYRYRRKAEEYAERIIKEAGCKTQLDMAYVFAKECLEFAVGLLKISRKYPSGTDGKELLEQRSTLMANTCLIQELLKRLKDMPDILECWPKAPNSHCFQVYESSTLLAIGSFCEEIELLFCVWLFKVTPFDSARNDSFPEIVPPTKWDDIDVNLEYRRVLANLMYEYEQADKDTFKKPIKAERNATPVKSERESWLWKLYEKTLKVIVDAVLERVWLK